MVWAVLWARSAYSAVRQVSSTDAMQEFRIQTSTFAPELAKHLEGGNCIVTRLGLNEFHGTAFEYLRNNLFDANDWFADSVGLPKPKNTRTISEVDSAGRFLKDKTFFFFSYEGLRLRLPQTELTQVPESFGPAGRRASHATLFERFPAYYTTLQMT